MSPRRSIGGAWPQSAPSSSSPRPRPCAGTARLSNYTTGPPAAIAQSAASSSLVWERPSAKPGDPSFVRRCSTPHGLPKRSATPTSSPARFWPTAGDGSLHTSSARWTPSACARLKARSKPSRTTIPDSRACWRCWPTSFITVGRRSGGGRWARWPWRQLGTGGDATVLAHRLANATGATWGTDGLQERARTSHELVELVQHLDDPHLTFWAALRRVVVGMQVGEPSQVEAGLATMRTLAASVP